jgi:hypothetical protein
VSVCDSDLDAIAANALLRGEVIEVFEDEIQRLVLRYADGKTVIIQGVWHNDDTTGISFGDAKQDPVGADWVLSHRKALS